MHFYITIFRSNKAFLTVAYAVIVLVMAFGVGIVLSTFLICSPIAKFWYHLLPGTCGNFDEFILATSIGNLVVDLTIILLPIPMVWWLQTLTRRKIELTITFTLGLVYVSWYMLPFRLMLTSSSTAFAPSLLSVSSWLLNFKSMIIPMVSHGLAL